MDVLFNIRNFNNINVKNDRLLNVDPDRNHDFQLPNYINVDPKNLLINQLSERPSVACHLMFLL